MTHIIAINDKTRQGKLVMEYLRNFNKSNSVKFLNDEELEKMEDNVFGKMISEGRTGEYVDTQKFLKKLHLK